MGEACGEEEMLQLARLAMRLRAFLYYTASSYALLLYALSVMSLTLIGVYLDAALRTGGFYTPLLALAGLVTATLAFSRFIGRIVRAAGGGDAPGTHGALRSLLLGVAAPLALVTLTGMITWYVNPSWAPLSWYPAIGLFLAWIYAAGGGAGYLRPHLLSGAAMLVTTPLVLAAGSELLAMGLMGASYLAGGVYAAYLGLREVAEGVE